MEYLISMNMINKSEITEIGYKNMKLYNDACDKINENKKKYGIFAHIFANLSIQDLYITFNKNKFNTIYPYDQKWYDIVNN